MRTMAKRPSSFRNELNKLLAERQITISKFLVILKSQSQFSRLHRSTIYRWSTLVEEKIPAQALMALEVLRNKPRISASADIVGKWIKKLQDLDEELGVVRRSVRQVIEQMTFHQS